MRAVAYIDGWKNKGGKISTENLTCRDGFAMALGKSPGFRILGPVNGGLATLKLT